MCSRKEIFLFFDKCEGKIINLFNGEEVWVEGINEVKIFFYDG